MRAPPSIDFTDEALKQVVTALPPGTPPGRAKLLSAVLRAWAQEDLREHLSREGHAVVRDREARLQAIKKQARDLLTAYVELDELSSFEIALRAQIHHQSAESWNVDVEFANRRRDEAIFWLDELVQALSEERTTPKPDTYTRHYLVLRDMAAIFELITGEAATRRTDYDKGTQYGPFWNFAKALWCAIYGKESGLQNAIIIWAQGASHQRKLADDELARAEAVLGRPLDPQGDGAIIERIVSRRRSFSPFMANLQFRHRNLWRKLEPPAR